MAALRALLLFSLVSSALCNYECICNYDVECPVRDQPSASGTIYGYMYEFDCKPTVQTVTKVPGWATIAMNNKAGYVKEGANVELQICTGDPSAMDIVTSTTTTSRATSTTPRQTTTTSTTHAPTTSTTATTTTQKPTTTTTQPTTTSTTQRPTTSATQTTTSTTQPPTTSTTQPSTTRTSQSTTEQQTTTQPTTTQPTRIITQAHTSQALVMNTTTWHQPTTTQQTLIVGNVKLCPAVLHQYTREDKGALTQYGNRCFEIVPIRAIWAKAENDCRAKGGHLFHIDDRAQQQFIYNWIKSFHFDHAVWTGLHDLINEEYFQWISGDHLLYTNWYPDRLGNLASHHIENCVLLVPYSPYFGQWDDVQCGIHTLFGDSGQQNPFICEYVIGAQGPHHASQLTLVG